MQLNRNRWCKGRGADVTNAEHFPKLAVRKPNDVNLCTN